MDNNHICVRRSNKKDIPSLKLLWKECFEVDDIYLNLVFSNLLNISTPIVSIKNNIVLSSLFFLPIYYKFFTNFYIEGLYIYGVCTRKTARGGHLSQLLINSVKEIALKEDKKFLMTCPANNSLFSLYRKIGFNYEIFKPKYLSTPINICNNPFSINNTNNHIKYIQNHSINKGFIWPYYMFDHICLDLQNNNNKIIPIKTNYYNTYLISPLYLDKTINKSINESINNISPYVLLMDLGLSKEIERENSEVFKESESFEDFIKYSFFNFPMR